MWELVTYSPACSSMISLPPGCWNRDTKMLSYFHNTTFFKTKECYEEGPGTSQGTAKAPKNKKNNFQASKGLTTSLPEDEAEVLSSKHFKIQIQSNLH